LKQLAVQQGDTVTVTAPGLYPQATEHNFWFSLASFLTGLLQPAPSLPAPPEAVRRGGLPLLQVGVAAGLASVPQLSGGVPKGYVRLLVFDADSNLVSQQTRQLSAAALNNYESLRLQVVVPQDGYVSAYVGNESNVDVFFDDVTVEHRQGLLVQETQYDPTGLELAGLVGTTPGLKPLNQYKFNGKEFQADLGLNWNHQDWRFFDPQLMRWHVTDPELENGQESWTPYSFGFNNAVRYNDLDGRLPGGIGALLDRAKSAIVEAKEAIVGSVARHFTNRPSDQRFAEQNTIAGARMHLVGNTARAKSEAARLAGQGDGSTTNALRHGMLSAMGAKTLGPGMAKKATDAHEGNNVNILQDRAKNVQELMRTGQTTMSNANETADSFVDQLNNAAGRQIAANNPGASDAQLQNLTLEALQGGNASLPSLYIFTPIGQDNVRVQRSTLSEGEFLQARWNMNEHVPSGARLFSPLP
jgi:RHS repeat-associated protein